MTNQHPITPPPELVEQWADMLSQRSDHHVFSLAAQWGADQELEACEMYLAQSPYPSWAKDFRAARRPKPPSLKEQALARLAELESKLGNDFPKTIADLRRALEALPND